MYFLILLFFSNVFCKFSHLFSNVYSRIFVCLVNRISYIIPFAPGFHKEHNGVIIIIFITMSLYDHSRTVGLSRVFTCVCEFSTCHIVILFSPACNWLHGLSIQADEQWKQLAWCPDCSASISLAASLMI